MNDENLNLTLNCPLPKTGYDTINIGHGGGGKLTNNLIDKLFAPIFKNEFLDQKHDSAILNNINGKLTVSTDSFVVKPLFFPGGDIGSLAVHGTVNDLSMAGARPLYLSVAFIIEEGFSIETLKKIVESIAKTAKKANVSIVTGDTKVVEKGKGDEIFINTTGIGIIEDDKAFLPKNIKIGDAIILSGDIGRHGMAIMSARENLGFKSEILSDATSLNEIVLELIKEKLDIHVMRDLTRGGLASALVELAGASKKHIHIEESKIKVEENIKAACEILGFDPINVANEGRFVIFLNEKDTPKALRVLRKHEASKNAELIGKVEEGKPLVTMKTLVGTSRVIDMISGIELPRIC